MGSTSLEFDSGNKLLVISDGVLELKNSNDEFYEDFLIAETEKFDVNDNRTLIRDILKSANKFSYSDTQIDDQTIIIIGKK